jgi:hypothetical protein
MKVAVKDANILIDLVNGGLLELCLRLPYEFVTTDLVLLQLEVEAQWFVVQPFVESGALRTVSLTGSEMEEVVADPIHFSLGLVDAQVLWLAAKEKGILLTGDLSLRQEAERRKVSVHGLLWIPDSNDRGGKARAASGRQGGEDYDGQRSPASRVGVRAPSAGMGKVR